MDADFTCLCAEDDASDTYEVADVEQFLENGVVEGLVLVGADVVAFDIHLDAALGVLQLHETGLAHHTAAHHASGHHHGAGLGIVGELIDDVGGECVGGEFGGWIWVDAKFAQLFQTLPSAYLLFV